MQAAPCIRGRNNYDNIECFFSEVKIVFDIVMFTETWFTCEKDVFEMHRYKS